MRSLTEKFRLLFPEISPGGHCCGHGHMSLQALLTGQIGLFNKRIKDIRFGIRKIMDAAVHDRIPFRLSDLKEICVGFGIDKEIEKEFPQAFQISAIKKIAQENSATNSGNQTIFRQKFFELVQKIDQAQLIPFLEKTFNSGISAEEFSGAELKQQMFLAWIIREKMIDSFKRRVLKQNQDILSERLKQEIAKRLADFDLLYPYVQNLIELETFYTNIALHHVPQAFTKLFSEDQAPITQELGLMFPLLSPIKLDNEQNEAGIVKLKSFSSRFNLYKLTLYFENLYQSIQTALSEQESWRDKSSLPFGLMLAIETHVFTIGFNPKTNNWIVINTGHPYEVERKDIAREILSLGPNLETFDIKSTNNRMTIAYNASKDQWYCIRSWRNPNPQPEQYPEFQQLALALSQSNALANLDLHINLHLQFYATNFDKKVCAEIVKNWWEKKEIQKAHAYHLSDIKAERVDDIYQHSLLYFVCRIGDLEILKDFLAHGADVNKEEKNCQSPFIAAISSGRLEVVKYLLQTQKAQATKKYADQSTPILYAIFNNFEPIVKLLLSYGANPNEKFLTKNLEFIPVNREQISILEFAIFKGMHEMVITLLRAGAHTDLPRCQHLEESDLLKLTKDKKMTEIIKRAYLHYPLQREILRLFASKKRLNLAEDSSPRKERLTDSVIHFK